MIKLCGTGRILKLTTVKAAHLLPCAADPCLRDALAARPVAASSRRTRLLPLFSCETSKAGRFLAIVCYA